MKKRNLIGIYLSLSLVAAFVLWTALVSTVDIQAIGPEGTEVGFATVNRFVHERVGVNMMLYNITDWLGLVPIGVVFAFAVLGLVQWIKRKSLLRVDRSILILGGFYLVVMAVYLLFEVIAVNYRPVLIEGRLEASYPSSTTMLVMCVMPTAISQLCSRIKSKVIRWICAITIGVFILFMVGCRIVSGVHWITDIIGGALVSAGLVTAYESLIRA